LRAARISLDRLGGATAAGDLFWAAQQAAAIRYYKGLWGHASLVLADGLDEYVDDLRQAGVTALIISADDILDFQQRLRTSGFTPTQLEAAGFLHLSTDELEAMRQERIADSPEELAGDVFADLNQASSALREIAQALSVYDTGSSTQPDYEPQQ
jgi:hypothetical protein